MRDISEILGSSRGFWG